MVISFYWWIIWRKIGLTITQGINRKSKDRQYTDQKKWIKGDTMIYNSAYKKTKQTSKNKWANSGTPEEKSNPAE